MFRTVHFRDTFYYCKHNPWYTVNPDPQPLVGLQFGTVGAWSGGMDRAIVECPTMRTARSDWQEWAIVIALATAIGILSALDGAGG